MPRRKPRERPADSFRRVLRFAECVDIDPLTLARRRLVRMKLECHHVIYRHDENATADDKQWCQGCEEGRRPKGISKAALERWGLG